MDNQTAKMLQDFLRTHEKADLIVYSEKTKLPEKAVYHSSAYHSRKFQEKFFKELRQEIEEEK